jgi:amidase
MGQSGLEEQRCDHRCRSREATARCGSLHRRQDQRRADAGDVEETTNPLFGPTRNPWNTGRVTGGSSGGSAAAVAAGLSCLDIGSDLGGSIRIPSAMCGVYGFKPTPGIVPLAGFGAPGESAAPMLDSVVALGPIAPSASDIRLSLRAIAGPVAPAATTLKWALSEPRHNRLRDFRVGVVLDDPDGRTTGPVGAVLSDLIDDLAGRHVAISRGWPQQFDARASQETFNYMIDAYLAFKFGEARPDSKLSDLIDHDQKRTSLQARWETSTDRGTHHFDGDRTAQIQRPRRVDRPCIRRRATGIDRACRNCLRRLAGRSAGDRRPVRRQHRNHLRGAARRGGCRV